VFYTLERKICNTENFQTQYQVIFKQCDRHIDIFDGKVKLSPLIGGEGPLVCEREVEALTFYRQSVDRSWVKLSGLHARRNLPTGRFLVLISVRD
jgi:hypothetical protein